VLGDVMRMLIVGSAVGVAAAIAATRVTRSFLFGATPTDPLTFATAIVLLAAAAFAAGYIPARRAGRVDPMVALRHD